MFIRTDKPVEEGCFDAQNKLWWDRKTNGPVDVRCEGCDPYLLGSYEIDGRPVKTAFQMLKERVAEYTPEWAAGITGIPVETIKRLAHEMGVTARDQKIELPIQWTDVWGREHDSVVGNPVAFHSMRGLAAHSNGFQTIRALGVLDDPAGYHRPPGRFRHKAPFPRPIPPCPKPPKGPEACSRTPAGRYAAGLAWPTERPVRRRSGQPGANRQGILLGIPAVGAWPDAQRHHQCLARRSVQGSTPCCCSWPTWRGTRQ